MDHDQPTSVDDTRPLAGTDVASAPPCSGFVRRDGTCSTRAGPHATGSPVAHVRGVF